MTRFGFEAPRQLDAATQTDLAVSTASETARTVDQTTQQAMVVAQKQPQLNICSGFRKLDCNAAFGVARPEGAEGDLLRGLLDKGGEGALQARKDAARAASVVDVPQVSDGTAGGSGGSSPKSHRLLREQQQQCTLDGAQAAAANSQCAQDVDERVAAIVRISCSDVEHCECE
eukprot:177674-Pleurochrysis_carterae.AAC.1